MIENTSGTMGAIVFYSPIGPAIIITKVNLLQSMTKHAIIQNKYSKHCTRTETSLHLVTKVFDVSADEDIHPYNLSTRRPCSSFQATISSSSSGLIRSLGAVVALVTPRNS